jgi:PE-PPE domain
MTHTACGADGSGCPDSNLVGIDYPASFWPLGFPPFSASWCPGLQCDKWDVSVQTGVDALDAAVANALHDPSKPDQDIVIFGYSQGGAVVSNELRVLNSSLTPSEKARVEVVLIGNIDNPVGGLWSLLGFLGHVPVLDVTTGLSTPPDTGMNYTTYYFEYDGVGNSPVAWGNLLAVANALAGFYEIHGTYLDPNQNSDFTGLPNGYTEADLLAAVNDPANIKTDQYGNTYVTVPTKTLPLASLILDVSDSIGLTPFVKPLVDLASPVARVLIDLAYDPNADPSVPQRLTILPIATVVNPIKLTLDLATATVEGIQAFLGDLGVGGLTMPAPATAPESTSLPAARSSSLEPEQVEQPSSSSVAERASAKNSKPVVAQPVSTRSGGTPAVESTKPESTPELAGDEKADAKKDAVPSSKKPNVRHSAGAGASRQPDRQAAAPGFRYVTRLTSMVSSTK